MRRSVGYVLLTILVLGALGAAGYGLYQIGFQQGLVENGAEVVVNAPGPAFYGGFHPGFWGIGILFKVLFFLLLVGLIARLAFGGRRWGWGTGPYRESWHGGPPPHIQDRMREWHDDAHRTPGAGDDSESG